MERSVSLAERSTVAAPANDLRCHSASYAASYVPTKVQRARSTTSVAAPAVQRSGSTRTVSGAGPTPGLNLRCYSASYAASYKPFSDGAAQAKGPNTTTAAPTWCSAGRRSLNLRSYTPSFSALVDNDAPAPAKTAAAAPDDADAELQRKKRLVAYKVYDVEGKVKGSVRRSVKWIKVKCSRAVYGW